MYREPERNRLTIFSAVRVSDIPPVSYQIQHDNRILRHTPACYSRVRVL